MQRRQSSHLCVCGGRWLTHEVSTEGQTRPRDGEPLKSCSCGESPSQKVAIGWALGQGRALELLEWIRGQKELLHRGGACAKTWTMNIFSSFRFFLGQMECHLHRSQLLANLPQLFMSALRPCLWNWVHTPAFTCVIPRPPITKLYSRVVPLEDFRIELFWVREVARVQHWTRMVWFLLLLSNL